jgi:hypothetical protein
MRRVAILSWLWLTATLVCAQTFSQYKTVLGDVLVQPGQFAPLPLAGNSFWCDSVPETMRQSYVKYGEQYLGKQWSTLPTSIFAQFKENGNRTTYEQLCFEKRRQLAALVMAEVADGKGRFLPEIIDGIGSFCEETWWGIPAHYKYKVPETGEQTVDLFNAETASLMAWTCYVLRPQLDRFSPLLVQRVGRELQRRILTPALKGSYWWKKAGMNWNPWICSNWLSCVLLFETDRQKQLEAVGQILDCMDAFINSYPEDGGCDEGPGYWDRAAASLYECLALLDAATGGKIDARQNPKLRAMASYAYKTYIGNGYVLSFADSHDNRYMQQLNIVYPFACYLDDATMRRFAKFIGEDKDYLHQAAQLYDRSGNFPTLGRELFFLHSIGNFQREEAAEPRLQQVWLKDLQIWTARSGQLFAAMKGGHNDESHNHNDVGEFVVYADGEPLLVDPGVGEYTSKTFSKERYTIWTMQSGYHNLPQINGCDQHDGMNYKARVISSSKTSLTLELAGAYPEEAAVSSWQRTVAMGKKEVKITERYVLREQKTDTRLMLLTPVRPDVSRQGMVSLGHYVLQYDPRQLTASVEDISPMLDPLLQAMWGQYMYRIRLTVMSGSQAGVVTYRVLKSS